jgi:hypothetical protein
MDLALAFCAPNNGVASSIPSLEPKFTDLAEVGIFPSSASLEAMVPKVSAPRAREEELGEHLSYNMEVAPQERKIYVAGESRPLTP